MDPADAAGETSRARRVGVKLERVMENRTHVTGPEPLARSTTYGQWRSNV